MRVVARLPTPDATRLPASAAAVCERNSCIRQIVSGSNPFAWQWSQLGRSAWSGDSPFAELISPNTSWPYQLSSEQITSRGSAASLVGGTLIAIPSGFGAVIAITAGGGNALVGVAIAAALLPPLVNCGLCWGMAFRWQLQDPQANWARDLVAVGASYLTQRQDILEAPLASTASRTHEPPEVLNTTAANRDGHPTTIKVKNVDIDVYYIDPGTVVELAAGGGHAHPYIVVALHGFWSFILFVSNFIGIVVVGGLTFRLKGVSRKAEDFPPYFPPLPPPRHTWYLWACVVRCVHTLCRGCERCGVVVKYEPLISADAVAPGVGGPGGLAGSHGSGHEGSTGFQGGAGGDMEAGGLPACRLVSRQRSGEVADVVRRAELDRARVLIGAL